MSEVTQQATASEISNLEDLLERISEAEEDDGRVSLEAILEAIGRRSFGPLILFAGLVTLSPVGDIPGVPTMVAVLVLLVTIQLLAGRRYFWLPGWLLRRSLTKKRLNKAISWMDRPAKVVDRLVRPRLVVLSTGRGVYVVAAACAMIALAMPPMELVPFTATGAGAALSAFGLALIAHDGVLAILAMAFSVVTLGSIGYQLFVG